MPNEQQRPSQPYITQAIELQSRYAQQAYRRSYKSASDSLYLLGIVLRIVGTQEQANNVETVIDELLKTCNDEIRQEAARLMKLLDDNSIETNVSYSNGIRFEPRITSPRSRQYLGMIVAVDELIGLMDALWLNGVLSDSQYSNASYMWQRRLIRLANRIRNITSRAISAAKNGGKEMQDELEQALSDAGVEIPAADEDDDEHDERGAGDAKVSDIRTKGKVVEGEGAAATKQAA